MEQGRLGKLNQIKADAVLMHLFGTEMEGAAACTKCQKGEGKFTSCVVMPSMGKGCSCCGFQAAGGTCSLVTGKYYIESAVHFCY